MRPPGRISSSFWTISMLVPRLQVNSSNLPPADIWSGNAHDLSGCCLSNARHASRRGQDRGGILEAFTPIQGWTGPLSGSEIFLLGGSWTLNSQRLPQRSQGRRHLFLERFTPDSSPKDYQARKGGQGRSSSRVPAGVEFPLGGRGSPEIPQHILALRASSASARGP